MGAQAWRDDAPRLSAVAHPLRWQLLRQLACGDLRVRELTAAVGAPQNLVSYHLGLLRTCGLVDTRRSAADGRELYYRANLAGCAQLLVETGEALHPGLRLHPRPVEAFAGRVSGRVLFVCTGNSARSPMAEALTSQLSGGAVEARSAGSHPRRLHPNTVAVMRRYGIDLADRAAVHLDALAGQHFDYIVTLCDRVREVCPEFPGPARHLHWSMANPVEAGDTDRESYPAFERAAAELTTRIPLFLELLTSKEAA
jgi:protein-tyrosine-phosphatase/DNA-binding transcriptional ArsR family regulator